MGKGVKKNFSPEQIEKRRAMMERINAARRIKKETAANAVPGIQAAGSPDGQPTYKPSGPTAQENIA